MSKVFVATRTHQQISQMVKQLEDYPHEVKTTILSSRTQSCVQESAHKAHNMEVACLQLREQASCNFYNNREQLAGGMRKERGHMWDLEDLVLCGKNTSGCPFYASRLLMQHAEVVFCPYSYLLDPLVREGTGVDLKNSVSSNCCPVPCEDVIRAER